MNARQTDGTNAGGVANNRSRAILAAIIQEHLHTGEPVGSRIISERFAHASGLSSATIRNVMGELEDAGLVEQPHTSAGRVPTDQGYRFYVNHLVDATELNREDREAIDNFLQISLLGGSRAPERLLERASQALSAISKNVGIVIAPAPSDNRLQHIEFVRLADHRILAVLVFVPNLIQHKIIRFDEDLSQIELERTGRYLNGEFSGKSLRTIRAEIIELMREEKALYDKLLRNAILLCEGSLSTSDDEAGEVFVDGASNILDHRSFTDSKRMQELFRAFEEKSRLVRILNECLEQEAETEGGVHVSIGRENVRPFMQNCAIITTPYRFDPQDAQAFGALALVGPVRMEYARMMALVEYTARLLEQVLWVESAHS
jgi:heat-inducible transcriptional repressor